MSREGSEWKPPETNPGMCLDGPWKLKNTSVRITGFKAENLIHELPNSMKAFHQFDHDACPQSAGV
jgi:hypothetical protein